MANDLTPPQGGDREHSQHHDDGRAGKKAKRELPSVEQLLHQLLQLNSAVLLGAVASREAGLIHKNIRAVLDVQLKRANPEEAGRNHEALADACRRDPKIINALAPFLSPEQLQALMDEIGGQE